MHAIFSMWTHPVPAVWTTEAWFTEAASVNVVAASAVCTVAHTFAVLTVGAHTALLITPVSSETFSTLALSSFRVALASVVTNTLLCTVRSISSLRTALGADCPRPSRGAIADPLPLTDASILAGASGWASTPGARLLTESPSESISADAFSCCFITGSSRPTLAPLQTALSEGSCWTRLFAVASDVTWGTLAGALYGVAQGSVFTFTLLTAAQAPVFVITGAGTVVPSPAALALASVWSHAATVDALSGAARDTLVSAFIIAWTALVSLTVVGLHRLPVGCLVGNPVAHASVGGPRVRAGFLSHLVVWMEIGLLH